MKRTFIVSYRIGIGLVLAFWYLVTLDACQPAVRPDKPAVQPPSPAPETAAGGWAVGKTLEGQASWYGKDFHGKLTANGDTFDMNGFSAAHRTMPLGSRVKVTFAQTGKSAEVLVNDRGPYVQGRILDLSHGAAEAIGLAAAGVGQVTIELLEVGQNRYQGGDIMPLPADDPLLAGGEAAEAVPVPSKNDASKAGGHAQSRLLLGVFESRWKAERLYYYLRGRFPTIRVEGTEGRYKVYIGPFINEKARKRILERLKQEGYDVKAG